VGRDGLVARHAERSPPTPRGRAAARAARAATVTAFVAAVSLLVVLLEVGRPRSALPSSRRCCCAGYAWAALSLDRFHPEPRAARLRLPGRRAHRWCWGLVLTRSLGSPWCPGDLATPRSSRPS
jgi:hypothetical protein